MTTRRLPKPLSSSDLHRLRAAAKADEWAVLTFLLETGLRSAEARSITSDEAGAWPRPGRWVHRQPTVTVRIIGKGDKERLIVLSREALLAACTLLPSANGHLIPWSERGLRWKMAELGKRAGVHLHPHRARHTWVTQLVEAGNPIEAVADMAGHSSVDTTRLYFLLSERSKRQAMQRRRRWLRRR